MPTTWAELLDLGDREVAPAADAVAEEPGARRGFFKRLRESLSTSRQALGGRGRLEPAWQEGLGARRRDEQARGVQATRERPQFTTLTGWRRPDQPVMRSVAP